ncbi:phosphatase Dcr2p [[Candida] jaroonii]|uniref:Phosphatase Dcr2p n=1 Tax=[Candida] jaroonii TaxID=467808 RepID=A0ACA9Y106_9ASCO|nr:phosphatase Dcr2p [[Candida] jaroonii]
MVGLPKRFVRIFAYGLGIFSFLGILLVIANNKQIIEINDYLPEYLIPNFFQPPADSYIIDISVKNCFRLNSKNPACGIPSRWEGMYGAFPGSNWVKVDKDLTLGNSYLNKLYFNYKTLSHKDAMENFNRRDNLKVVTDIAMFSPSDRSIKGNKDNIPKKILDEIKSGGVFDEEALEFYSNFNVQGELYKEDSHKHKASEANKEYEKEMLAKQAEEQIAQEKENKQEEAQKDAKEQEVGEEIIEEEGEWKDEGKKEDPKKEDSSKEDPKKEDPVIAKEPSEGDSKKPSLDLELVEGSKKKRKVETDNTDLDVTYIIPTKDELEAKGWTYKSHGVWVKYESYKNKRAITGIDVLFGKEVVDPRPNWNLVKGEVKDIKSKLPARFSFRRGPKLDYKSKDFQKTLKVDKDGKFKILQVADLHFSTGFGKCRDPVPESSAKGCKADSRTLKFLEKVLSIEKPDLVVLTGDQIFGDAAPDSESALFKALNPFIKRKIPFAVTMGNHDDEGSLKRSEIMSLSANLPYSLSALGPDEVAGVGNYIVNVQGNKSKHSAILLYLLDTHKYSPNPKVNPGYDWIKESQLKFLEREYATMKPSIEAYKDKHLDMAFFHIPIPEYRNLKDQPFIGEHREGITAPKYNTGARNILGQLGVKVVSVGHDHANDYCLEDIKDKDDVNHENKMWLCYGGGSGEGGYGGYGGYVRRLRVFDLDTSKGEIKSWKRLESDPDNKIDEQILVTGGEVVNF